MGEIADMMLDGTLCSQCGEYIGGDDGYPVACAGCRDESESGSDEYELVSQENGENQIDYIFRLKKLGFVNRQIASMTGLSLRGLKKKITAHNKSIGTAG